MKIIMNGKNIDGLTGNAIGCYVLFFVGALFLFLGFLFLLPVIIPIIVLFLIGKII